MFYEFESRLKLEGALEAKTALRIGAGRSTSPTSLDLPVVKDAVGRPYIPGSSLKGVLRSNIEAMVRAVVGSNPQPSKSSPGKSQQLKIVCNPTNNDEWCIPAQKNDDRIDIGTLRDRRDQEGWDDIRFTDEITENTCLVCRLCGSPWLASRLQLRDLLVERETWFGQFQERNGVAIDRDKEVAADGKLYDFEVVPAGVRFAFSAIAENAKPWQLGMLWAGLRAFEEGDIAIGGATSRGLGVVKLDLTTKTYTRPDGTDALLDLLIDGGGSNDVDPKLIDEWRQAFRDKLRRVVTTGDGNA